MSVYLLNTSVLVDAFRGVLGRADMLGRQVAEIFSGMRPSEREATVTLLDSLEHYDITRPVAERTGLLRREWRARGKTLALPDLLIASVALTHKLILVTDNARDTPMKDLQVHSLGEETGR